MTIRSRRKWPSQSSPPSRSRRFSKGITATANARGWADRGGAGKTGTEQKSVKNTSAENAGRHRAHRLSLHGKNTGALGSGQWANRRVNPFGSLAIPPSGNPRWEHSILAGKILADPFTAAFGAAFGAVFGEAVHWRNPKRPCEAGEAHGRESGPAATDEWPRGSSLAFFREAPGSGGRKNGHAVLRRTRG